MAGLSVMCQCTLHFFLDLDARLRRQYQTPMTQMYSSLEYLKLLCRLVLADVQGQNLRLPATLTGCRFICI